MNWICGYFFLIVLITGCTHWEKRNKQISEDGLYMEYLISGEEDDPNVHCRFRFLQGGPEGTAISLSGGARVVMDGEIISADSAGLSGVYYETERPLQEFKGRHSIVFTDAGHQIFKEEFVFFPFSLASLPEQIKRQPFEIHLNDFISKGARVHLLLVDTAFGTNDVNEFMNISKATIPVTESMLGRLSDGPINLEVYREEERPLKKGYGKLVVSYGVKREFELVNE